jgi:hypothetical protein
MDDLRLTRVLRILIVFAIFMILLHCVEIIIWSVVYLNLPNIVEIKSFEEAFYFSLLIFLFVIIK